MKTSAELETQAALTVAGLMAAAARTAPKSRGIDNIIVFSVEDADTKARIADKMREIARRENRPTFERDANSVAGATAFVVIGVVDNPASMDCGVCGHPTCDALRDSGGHCSFNSFDLGIAISSAAAVASQFHIDNRIMWSIARACVDLKMFNANVRQALALPLSVSGKNPFFDRKA
jgi:uncharacterized ferredoxin-like protein